MRKIDCTWSVGTKASISCWFDIPRMHRPFYENGIPSSSSIFLVFPSLTLPFYRHPTGLFLFSLFLPFPPPPILLPVHWKPNGNCVSRNSFFPPGLHLATIDGGCIVSRISCVLFSCTLIIICNAPLIGNLIVPRTIPKPYYIRYIFLNDLDLEGKFMLM